MKKEVEMFEKFLKRLDPKDAQLKPGRVRYHAVMWTG